jgi:Zn-dependent protease with chaperone function
MHAHVRSQELLPSFPVNEDKSSRYHRLKRRSAVASGVLGAGLLIVLVATGASVALRDAAMALSGGSPGGLATVLVYVLALALLQEAVVLPVAWYRSFLLERRYGLSSEPLASWLADHAKAAGLGLALAVGGGLFVYFALSASPTWWWLFSAVVFMAATAGLARVAPLVLLPLFYKFTPLDRESLRARLVALSSQAGVPVLGVYEWGLGQKTRRANAALVGTGAARRIIVSDTLLAEYSDDEIEVILAHELAHHVHKDIPKGLAVEFALLLTSFYAASMALNLGWQRAGLASPADVAGLPLMLLAGGATMLAATPFENALSRLHERSADRYALAMTRQPAAFISAMRRLAAQNLAEERPSRATLWLFHTHPPIEQRIEAARQELDGARLLVLGGP